MHAVPIEVLIEKFEQLPGIGRKSAERIAFHILDSMSKQEVQEMAEGILHAKNSICLCPVCQNLTDTAPCAVCASPERDHSVICVVENPKDVSAIEKTNEYCGVYHVLQGALSSMDGIAPEDLKIKAVRADRRGSGFGGHYGNKSKRQRNGDRGLFIKAASANGNPCDQNCPWHSGWRRSGICRRGHLHKSA